MAWAGQPEKVEYTSAFLSLYPACDFLWPTECDTSDNVLVLKLGLSLEPCPGNHVNNPRMACWTTKTTSYPNLDMLD